MSEFNYAEKLNRFINNETISEIVIVNDIHCTFIVNTVQKHQNYGTKAEKVLYNLQKNNKNEFKSLNSIQQQILLAKLNIYRQAHELICGAFIGNLVKDGIIELSGLLYNMENQEFEKLKLNL